MHSALEPAPAPTATLAGAGTAAHALARGVEHLRHLQDSGGWWKGELETNVTMDAEDLFMRHVLGIGDPDATAEAARWIRSQQRPDGSWATFEGGPADLSTTVEAYVALRMAGDPSDSAHLRRAAALVRDQGGLQASRVFTRIWLALLGQWSWDDLPALPPELIWLPPWAPLNIYDWGCWARQTVVPLTVVSALRVCRPLAFGLGELRTGTVPPRPGSWRTAAGAVEHLDRALRRYHRRRPGRLRRDALTRSVEWVVRRQEADGSWGGIQPPWVYSILALRAAGYPLDHPVVRSALDGLESFIVREPGPDGTVRRLEACQSPVWDTALAVIALRDAGVGLDDPALAAAADWLSAEEIRCRGDWAVRRPDLAPGGWAFEFHNDGYPDIDDTAEVVLALQGHQPAEPAVRRGIEWVLGMQCRDGGWAAFDADNTSSLIGRLPFCDFGAVTDPPSADVTAHVVEMLARLGVGPEAMARGVDWLLREQDADGSWFGRWGANHVYGTGAVLPALAAAGVGADHPAVRRAVHWLLEHQNGDGGWGEDLRSYRDPAWRGTGASTASQTAWALLALLAAERADGQTDVAAGAAVRAGVGWLVAHQRADGTWDEPQFTGTGFPGDFFINYHLYRLVFPVTALARYAAAHHDEAQEVR